MTITKALIQLRDDLRTWVLNNLTIKLDKNLGSTESGKFLSVDENGDIIPSTISASGGIVSVTTGTSNGTISVDGSDVAVKGLSSAAYKATSDFATALQGKKADSAVQDITAGEGIIVSGDVIWEDVTYKSLGVAGIQIDKALPDGYSISDGWVTNLTIDGTTYYGVSGRGSSTQTTFTEPSNLTYNTTGTATVIFHNPIPTVSADLSDRMPSIDQMLLKSDPVNIDRIPLYCSTDKVMKSVLLGKIMVLIRDGITSVASATTAESLTDSVSGYKLTVPELTEDGVVALASDIVDAVEAALTEAKASGEFDGDPGTKWYCGTVVADDSTPVISVDGARIGDFYLNSDTNNYYEAGSAGLWILKGKLGMTETEIKAYIDKSIG